MSLATSNIPSIPIVEFTTSLPVLIAANFRSPCRTLFGIVIKVDRLFKAFPVPFLIGTGKALYPLATGLKITLSKPWLRAKDARFKNVEQHESAAKVMETEGLEGEKAKTNQKL